MLSTYIASAMKQARYELLEWDEGYYGEIPWLDGVWANAEDLELCREELQSVLEEWLVIKLRKKVLIPETKTYDLNTVLCEN